MHIAWRPFALIIIILGASCASYEDDPGRFKYIEVTSVVDLTALIPGVTYPRPISPNPIAIDRRGNIYFLDPEAHRIMKYDLHGRFITQIGSIGQGKENLYKPWGIFIENDALVVLNENATEIKFFSLDGIYQSSFLLQNTWYCHSLFVHNGLLYLNIIQKSQPEDSGDELITIYTKTGELIQKIGPLVKCRSVYGYATFNEILMGVSNDRLFWAHVNTPRIGYGSIDDLNNCAVTNLISTKMPEFLNHAEWAKNEGHDTPDKEEQNENHQMKFVRYCYGFGVDEKNQIYYASLVLSDSTKTHKSFYAIRVMQGDGKILETIIPRFRGEALELSHMIVGPQNVRYGIGEIKGKTLLFKFS